MGQDAEIKKPRRPRSNSDWYVEERWAVYNLFDKIRFSGSVWDPACGSGQIPRIAEEMGHRAWGSDLVHRGYMGSGGQDFLEYRRAHASADNIICNPPYRQAGKFVDQALRLANNKVAMLMRLAFLESEGRREWFPRTPLACVLVSSARMNMPPGELLADPEFKREGGEIAFAWFIWDHDWDGPPTVKWMAGPPKKQRSSRKGERHEGELELPIVQ